MIFTPHREYGSKRFLAFRRRCGRSRRPQPTFVRQCRCRSEALECRAMLIGLDPADFSLVPNGRSNRSPIAGEITWVNGVRAQFNSKYFEGVSTLLRTLSSRIEESFEDHCTLLFTYLTQRSGS
jgi:hypothetical protein